ncbi:MAG TPA: glycosyltransferase, partial [Acidimicrobiales bacterium]|nr:glycosyltransferase [Acidimicrobiales bacterium]
GGPMVEQAMKCSVVMATFNGSTHVGAQLESLRAQSRAPDELIVSDDGSSDGTLAIVHSFRRNAPFPVEVVSAPRLGCAENFWQAAQHAHGEAVAWCDQDDVWHPDKLALCLAALADHGASMVAHAAAVVGAELEPTGRAHPHYRKLRVLGPLEGDPLHVPPGFASVFLRTLLDEVDWANRPVSHQHHYQLPHDHAVSLYVFGAHRRVELPDALAQYRQHGRNLAGAPKPPRVADIRVALRDAGDGYAALAERVSGYARWFEGAGRNEAGGYFRELAQRALLRHNLRGQAAVPQRWASLASGVRAGAYRGRYRGGFGTGAMASDLASLCLATGAVAAARIGAGGPGRRRGRLGSVDQR